MTTRPFRRAWRSSFLCRCFARRGMRDKRHLFTLSSERIVPRLANECGWRWHPAAHCDFQLRIAHARRAHAAHCLLGCGPVPGRSLVHRRSVDSFRIRVVVDAHDGTVWAQEGNSDVFELERLDRTEHVVCRLVACGLLLDHVPAPAHELVQIPFLIALQVPFSPWRVRRHVSPGIWVVISRG